MWRGVGARERLLLSRNVAVPRPVCLILLESGFLYAPDLFYTFSCVAALTGGVYVLLWVACLRWNKSSLVQVPESVSRRKLGISSSLV